MKTTTTSASRLGRMSARQRKKLHLGEFQELVFEIEIGFAQPLDEDAAGAFIDDFFEFVESRGLCAGGLGGQSPLASAAGVITTWDKGSTTDEDREAVTAWLRARPEVARAEAGALRDGWYGWR